MPGGNDSPPCNHIYGSDARWWRCHIGDIARDYDGQCWTVDHAWDTGPKSQQVDPRSWGLHALRAEVSAGGFSRRQDTLHTGTNSGYAALNLAYHLGATLILMLGYDLSKDGDRRHWFGNHPGEMNVNSDYNRFISRFQTIKPAEYGIEIWNCSRRTALTHFPCYNLDEVINKVQT